MLRKAIGTLKIKGIITALILHIHISNLEMSDFATQQYFS